MKHACRAALAAAALAIGAASYGADEPAAPRAAAPKGHIHPGVPDIVQNPGFEQSNPAVKIPGWLGVFHGGDSFRIEVDATQAHSGKKSLLIENTGPTSWGGANQTVPADSIAGREVELSAWVKTKGVTAPGFNIALRIQTAGGQPGYAESATRLTGDNGWTAMKLRTRMPADARTAELLLIQDGDGKTWVDDVRLEPVPEK